MDIKELVRNIIDGKLTVEETNAINIAIREREKIQQMENSINFRIGSIVSIFNLTPNGWNGMQGKIVKFSPQRARVDLEMTKADRFVNKRGDFVKVGTIQRGFPVSNLQLVNAPIMLDVVVSDETDATALHAFLGR